MLAKLIVPKFGPRKYQSWHGWLVLAVLAVAVVLGVVHHFAKPRVPTSDVAAVTWRDLNIDDITQPAVTTPSATTEPTANEPTTEPTPQPEPTPAVVEPTPVPTSANLAVPFTSQAPSSNWDALHEDACEEASIYMVHEYYAGTPADTKIDPTVADPVITALVHYGADQLADGPSITAAQVAALITSYYPTFTATVVDNPSIDDIKSAINAGHPVLVPAAGRLLGNPNFSGEGPLYHMLVIRGYDATHFITNDPGTRLGQNYTYSTDVMMNAIRDWNDGDPLTGTPRIVIMTPKSP